MQIGLISFTVLCFYAPPPRHEMVEGHIEFTLSVFVYSRIVSGPYLSHT